MYENVKYEIVPCPWSPLHWRNARLWWWWQHTCIIPAVATLYSVPGEHWRRCSAAYNDTMYTVFVLSSCHCRGSWPCLPGPHIRLPPRPQSWPDTMSGHYNQAYDDGGEPGAQEIGRRGHIVSTWTWSWTFEHRQTNEWANQRTIDNKTFADSNGNFILSLCISTFLHNIQSSFIWPEFTGCFYNDNLQI